MRRLSFALSLCVGLAACAQSITTPVEGQDARTGSPDRGTALDAEVPDVPSPLPDGGAEVPDAGAPDAACTPVCGARRCGVDPVCGASCGTCSGNQACSLQGECIDSCTIGSSACGGDGVSYQGCGFDEALGVANLGPRIACGSGATCQAGRCRGSCAPAQIVIVVDRSASIAANNTWSWMRDELLGAVGAYQNDNAFGLRQFPDGACSPGTTRAPARDARVALERAFVPPSTEASSPIADALAGLLPSFSGQDDGRAVILLTDGDETCRTEADATRAASLLLRAGVRTYPIAIGNANRTFLDRVAFAGGTTVARAVSDAAGLRAALGEIVADVGACRNAHGQVELGWYHSCGIRASGQLACWGRTQDNRHLPPAGRFTSLGASTDASCAVAQDGRVRCWGRDLYGQLFAPAGVFSEVAGGNAHYCARRLDGTVACWGDDRDGQATAPLGTFKQVTAQAFGSCGILMDDTVDCWGQAIAPSGTFRHIDGGSFAMCGVRTDGSLDCTGTFGGGEPTGTFTQVSLGDSTACALRSDATLACWGSDIYQLITNAPGGRFVDVSVSYMTACAVRESDDAILCWGYDDEGMASPPP